MADDTVLIAHRQINCEMVIKGGDSKTYKVPCILDTGAMNVCLPDAICRQMKLIKLGTTHASGANGVSEVPVYRAPVGIAGLDGFEESVEILGLHSNTALLGFELFSRLDRINIDFLFGTATFHKDDHSVIH